VVGEIATEGELHTYGVAFLDEGPDFWQTERNFRRLRCRMRGQWRCLWNAVRAAKGRR
jgi:hypothetical protein